MRTALTIAGSDSVGGAGIQADIKAMAAVGVHATTVVTAVTSQNTCKVSDIYAMPADIVRSQLEAVLSDCDIKAMKTGMLYSGEIVGVVVDAIDDHDAPLIVDPVMVATVGADLSDVSLVRALKDDLLPVCELVTPNRHEAEILANMKIKSMDDAMLACEKIGKQGTSVLLKGGHMDTTNVVDLLYLSSEFTEIKYPRLKKAGHGSGCTLSAYITANMAKGNDLVNSVLRSRELIQEAIASQYAIGKGEVVVNPAVMGGKDKAKFPVLEAVDEAARKLAGMVPQRMVPKGGMNIAYAMQNAAGPEEIAAIDGRMKMHNGTLVKSGQAKLGVAEHLSFVLLGVMKFNPSCRCVITVADSTDTQSIMEEVGLTASKLSKKNGRSLSDAVGEAISRNGGKVPDAIVDVSENTVMILGRDPDAAIGKLDAIL